MNKLKSILATLALACGASAAWAAATDATFSGTLPVMHIETENHDSILSKEVYLNATYWLDPMGAEGVDAVGSQAEPLPLQIRGRGNSSWLTPKKPYKIKLEKKTALMGMPKNKHWALLKATENITGGLLLGDIFGLAWTPKLKPVEVVLNGDYIGLYLLTETIRIGANRVNIFEQQDQETDPELIRGGWLVEVDNYSDECQITLRENDNWNLRITYHSPEDLSDEQQTWLKNEFTAINKAIYNPDKSSAEWEKYIDLESMAKFFIIQEAWDNPDGFHGSFYLHKDLGDSAKWVAGPLWDPTIQDRGKTDYTFNMKAGYTFTPHWIGEIIKFPSFCQAVDSIWHDIYPEKIEAVYDRIDQALLPMGPALVNDAIRWREGLGYTAELRANRVKAALRMNLEWFDAHIPEPDPASLPTATVGADCQHAVAYNLQGIRVGQFATEAEAVDALPPGIYIIDSRKIIIRK